MAVATGVRLLKELRRRRVFRSAALYVAAVWLLMQAANILFPAWGIPSEAIRYLSLASLAGFPVALVFSWIFQITPEGIQRTPPEWSDDELRTAVPLNRVDFLILTVFVLLIGMLIFDATDRVLRIAPLASEEPPLRLAELMDNSLAVLPFSNLSADPEHELFADGISEEILNRLAAFSELKVIARTSSFIFKDSGFDVRRICDLLGVKYLLQGSVRRDDGRLRISATLVDRNGFQLWHTTLDRERGGIFALQDEIAEAVATSIVPRIAPLPVPMRLPGLAAYEQYLMGRELLATRPPGWLPRAHEYFSRAIELDLEFAEPYAERAIVTTLDRNWLRDENELLDEAQRDTDVALALKPSLARGYAAQVMVEWRRNPAALAARERMLLKVLDLDSNMVDALNWLSIVLSEQGRIGESEAVLRRALRIDPLAPAVNFNLALREAGRGNFSEAEARLLRLLEVPNPAELTFTGLLDLYYKTGRLVDFVQMRKERLLDPGSVAGLAVIYAVLGMWEQADYWQAEAERRWPEDYFLRLHRVRIARYSGQVEVEQLAPAFRTLLAETNTEIDRLPMFLAMAYGELQTLSGEYDGAIATLQPLVGPGRPRPQGATSFTPTQLSLAWAWLQTDRSSQALALLRPMQAIYLERLTAEERVADSEWLALFALNTLLLGEVARAIQLLEDAVDVGWRDHYSMVQDPRWESLRGHPRVVDLLARVKADIDRQRAELEAIEAENDFVGR